ncbi:hypothetical protein GCM10011487_27040 [Steroidobacter agaridevorans]|uniref:Formate C-acetyltransferase glycine radical n=1 Tax=Steroidobacter agaridevorans TaxID=2695856 RepID=A0A829YBF2_9GAMM|nr:DUF2254 domain-containing protein [Steroidobacter agaridevorans]GFE80704.1 hypothetical protein GCM10011487_27040 [Steroidobacter agaridevorans]
MTARLRKLLYALGNAFWLLPAAMVILGILSAFALIAVDRSGLISSRILQGNWLYNGGGTGARTLLGAVAASTIGVAGTVFSITIAALSLAAGQMGPRLLQNFTRDRGNQITLGAFLGTFSYAMMVLRSVRTQSEGEFVPHLALSVGILLAFFCVATLVFFVGHMAGRINVDSVIDLVGTEVRKAIARLTVADPEPAPPPASFWLHSTEVVDDRRGYLQQLDADTLADWAAVNETAIRLLLRPGEYLFPGAVIALVTPAVEGAGVAIRDATALSSQRASSADLESEIRQLVEVAVRALSPGINDPHTAMSVLDRLGAALCDVASVHLPTGVHLRNDRPALIVPSVNYDGLTDSMFHLIRQNAAGNAATLIRMLEVLTAVVGCEHDTIRRQSLQRHVDLILDDAKRNIENPADLADVRARHENFATMMEHGAIGAVCGARLSPRCASTL